MNREHFIFMNPFSTLCCLFSMRSRHMWKLISYESNQGTALVTAWLGRLYNGGDSVIVACFSYLYDEVKACILNYHR